MSNREPKKPGRKLRGSAVIAATALVAAMAAESVAVAAEETRPAPGQAAARGQRVTLNVSREEVTLTTDGAVLADSMLARVWASDPEQVLGHLRRGLGGNLRREQVRVRGTGVVLSGLSAAQRDKLKDAQKGKWNVLCNISINYQCGKA